MRKFDQKEKQQNTKVEKNSNIYLESTLRKCPVNKLDELIKINNSFLQINK